MPQRRNLLQPEGSHRRHRAMAQSIQHDPTVTGSSFGGAPVGIIRLWPILSTAQLRDRFNESPASVEATPATTTKPSIAEFIRRLENWASNRFRQNRQSRPRDIAQPSGRGQMFPSKISR